MKKALIMALAGFMMLAFTQCGGSVSGSKEYNDTMSHLKKAEKAIKNAKNCEDLEKAGDLFWFGIEDMEYAKEDQMTEEERKKAVEYLEQVGVTFKDLTEKLGCD